MKRVFNISRGILAVLLPGIACFGVLPLAAKCQNSVINIVYTSDAHYGITRKEFRGQKDVDGHTVNAAMIQKINTLSQSALPDDKGVGAGKSVTAIDYLIQTGDIANRMEPPYPTAAADWAQFETDYIHSLHLKDHAGTPATLLVAPGNHDISNAIGFGKLMSPKTDPTAMVQIYNLMLKPARPMTNDRYDYNKDKINYSRNIGGVHFQFITLWPDSAERIWMEKDLHAVAKTTPVIIFCHDQPTSEPKHFTNPLPPYNMTAKNHFENLVAEHYKEGKIAPKDDDATAIEQRGWVAFLKLHPNIKAYFHGNSNYNEFYTYTGPDHDVELPIFRVDSPMKGKYSAADETKLSFQLISLDAEKKLLTVRACFWNTRPGNPEAPIVFRETKTIALQVN